MRAISRRRFLQAAGSTGAAAVAAAALPRPAWANPMNLPVGIQLYVVGKPLLEDAPGTLKQLHEIGYREVETAGFGKYTAREFRALIDAAGLSCPSAHLQLTASEIEPLFDDAHALGASYATSSILRDPPAQKTPPAAPGAAPTPFPALGSDGFKRIAAHMNSIGAKAKAAGLKYAYHNHNFEFEKVRDREYGYDILIKETDPELVFFEIDCGWMVVAGVSPVEYMRKYPKRIRMLHIKDFQPVATPTIDLRGPGRPKGTELGKGFIDYAPIFAEGRESGIQHCFAEQEGPYEVPLLEAAKLDYEYLHSFS